MSKIEIGLKEKIHFIGIGGIGMSGLAQVMKTMGFMVQGSDLSSSKNVERCKKIGIKVFKSHSIKNLKGTTVLYNFTEALAGSKRSQRVWPQKGPPAAFKPAA